MKKRALALVCLLALCGCGQTAPSAAQPPSPLPREAQALSAGEAAPGGDRVREDTVAVGETVYTIRRIGTAGPGGDHPVLDRVEVYERDAAAPVQTFADFRADGAPPLDGDLLAEDLNFDGWTDFRVFGGYSNAGERWHCWLLDPGTGGFLYDAVLSELRECVWDMEGQEIYTAEYAGLSGAAYGVYAWEDGELVCLREFQVSVDYLEPPFSVVNRYFLRRDGELQLERTWRADAGAWGEFLVAPEAQVFLEQVTPPASRPLKRS